jgi:hypothetical protein
MVETVKEPSLQPLHGKLFVVLFIYGSSLK